MADRLQNNPFAALATRFVGNRYLLGFAILVIVLAGYSAITNMPRIEDPRITNRYPKVVTFLPGSSAARVEALVTDKIEDKLKEISEIIEMDSTSRSGVSVIAIELAAEVGPDTNEEIFSKIRDRLSEAASELPAGSSAPFFDDKNSAVAFSLIASVEWRAGSAMDLGTLKRVADDLADKLRSVPGTDTVRLYGAPQEEINVTVDGAELASLGLSVARVAQSIDAADPKLPAGALRNAERDLFIEVAGEFDSLQRVRSVPIVANGVGRSLALGDIATVEKSWRDPPQEMGFRDGNRSIFVAVRTQRDIRLDLWAGKAKIIVSDYGRTLSPDINVGVAFDQNLYTSERLSTLTGNLLAGAVVVMLVVFLGMGLRAALIVGAALPMSGALALFGLSVGGQQIHQMSIFGLIIAIGLLIDNAIVMTDEVKKQLDEGAERIAALRNALSHLFVPLLASTLTTVLGFMPVFLLPGAMGDFVGPIAFSVVLALIASFFVSMTIIPALAAIFLKRRDEQTTTRWWVDGFSDNRCASVYSTFLRAVMRRPLRAALLCMCLPLTGFVLAGTLGQQFFPAAERDQFEVQIWMPSDASVSKTARTAAAVENEIKKYDGVREVHWRIGGSFPTVYYNRIMTQDGNGSYANGIVYTDTVADAFRLTTELPKVIGDRFTDAQVVVTPFAQGPPVFAPVGFKVTGPDIAVLKSLGDELRRIMHTVPEVVHTRASVGGGQQKLLLRADEQEARVSGLSLTAIAGQLQTSLEGQLGGSILENQDELPVRIRIASAERSAPSDIDSLNLVSAGGTGRLLPISAVGELALVPDASGVTRTDGLRVNNIFGYILRDALPIDVTRTIRERLIEEGFTLPAGYTISEEGDSEQSAEAFGELLLYLPVLLTLMIATIVLSFRSIKLATLIATVAVFSVGLGMLSLWLGGYPRGFNAIIGSIGLIGVAINGTIVVLAAIRANPLARNGDAEAIVEETLGATRHIVSTTATTIGGFLPLLIAGGEFWPPLAIVIAGGVGFSITLSLIFTPSVYRLIGSASARRQATHVALPAAVG